jgi:hypothetical protein
VKTIAYLSARRETATPVIRAVDDAAAACDGRVVRFDELVGLPVGLGTDLHRFIQSADVVVAHVPRLNANLLYEIGVAHGLGKPVIFIAPTSVNLPIDLRGERVISYAPKPDVAKLSFALKEWLQELNRTREFENRETRVSSTAIPSRVFYSHSGEALEDAVAKALASVSGWEVQAASPNERDGGFDFIIWNQKADSTLAALGNPIAVEVKSRPPSIDTVRHLVEITKRQGLKAILLIVGSPMPKKLRRSFGSVGNRAGVIVLALDNTDIESIDSPDDLPRKLRQNVIDLRLA